MILQLYVLLAIIVAYFLEQQYKKYYSDPM